MGILVFATETTGFMPGDICQLSYIIADDKLQSATGRNYFFAVDYVEPGALNVHGFSPKVLKELSGGLRFGSHADEILNNFESCSLWVAHNFDFDMRFIASEINNAGLKVSPASSFCTMKRLTGACSLPFNKWPKLEELTRYFGITKKKITSFCSQVFDINDINAHDARYDCAATYLCFKKCVEKGLVDAIG